MSTQRWATFAALIKRQQAKLFRRILKAALLVGALAVISGCGNAPSQPFAGPDPSNPHARTPIARYHSTLGSFINQRPVEPADWKGSNERITPQPKSGQ
jgi:hypothetical protein